MFDIVSLERTDHCAARNIIGVNNVKVASILSVNKVLVGCKLVVMKRLKTHEY